MVSMFGYFIAFKVVANVDKTTILLKMCLLYVQCIIDSLFLFSATDNSFCRYILCSLINCINVFTKYIISKVFFYRRSVFLLFESFSCLWVHLHISFWKTQNFSNFVWVFFVCCNRMYLPGICLLICLHITADML